MEENFPMLQTAVIAVLLKRKKGAEDVVSLTYAPPAKDSSVMVCSKSISYLTVHDNLKQFQACAEEHNITIDHLTCSQVYPKSCGFSKVLLNETEVELCSSTIIY